MSERPVTLPDLLAWKQARQPVVMITAYDYPSARAADLAGVDLVLVGDSAAMTVLGLPSTAPIELDELIMLAKAVRRGLTRPLMVGDLPFGSYEISDEQAVGSAIRLVKEAGCDAVKLEGGGSTALARVTAILGAGIPVVGHVGLTPQTATALGGYRAQGRDVATARKIIEQAVALQQAGCCAIVVEAVPRQLTEELMPRLSDTVVIGIGAGSATDGQVLVQHDLLGLGAGPSPRFVRRYADLQDATVAAIGAYAQDVRTREYPGREHSYSMSAEQRALLAETLD